MARSLKRLLELPVISVPLATLARRLGRRLPAAAANHLPVAGTFRVPCRSSFFWLRASSDDSVAHEVVLRGVEAYETTTMPRFLDLASRSQGAILDVGANVGVYALAAAAVNTSAEVYAFEPVPRNYERLIANAALNSRARLHPHQLAVSDSIGERQLFVPVGGFPLEASLLRGFRPDTETVDVVTTTLDAFVREAGIARVGLIKIDIEGMEHVVIRGALEVLARDRPQIICEILPSRPAADELPGLLRPLGYSFFHLTAKGPIEFVGDLAGYAAGGAFNFLISATRILLRNHQEVGLPRICTRCVMDTTDSDISFDPAGVCNHCRDYEVMALALAGNRTGGPLAELVEGIKQAGKNAEHDCVIGLSGGVDSSYVAYLSKQLGLRPLAVHLDNGWDTELAIQNIHNLVSRLSIDLITHVIDWPEFRALQLAYLRSSTVDTEVLTDHAITAVLFDAARAEGIKYILSGNNSATESVMPQSWNYRKTDRRNLKAIVRAHGDGVMPKTMPTTSTTKLIAEQYLRGRRIIGLLDYVPYDKAAVREVLERELGWRPYAGKHYESFFTRIYQSYILPSKFRIDKRRAHFSALICAGQLDREEALRELEAPPYDPATLDEDIAYLVKKLGIDRPEFDRIMELPTRSHHDYATEEVYVRPMRLGIQALLRARRGVLGPRRSDPPPPDQRVERSASGG